LQKIARAVLTLLLFSIVAAAQVNPQVEAAFSYYYTASLSGTASVVTIQHTIYDQKIVQFKSAYLYCSAATIIDLEKNGTTATTTVGTITAVNPNTPRVQTAQARAYRSSNVGVGTVLQEYQLSAGMGMSIDLTNIRLDSALASNLSFRTNSTTASCTIGITWFEQ
jgi:hypothetical protein